MENAIKVENLTHRFGRRTICEKLNFEIPAGKIFGLLGKNGVGKTTVCRVCRSRTTTRIEWISS